MDGRSQYTDLCNPSDGKHVRSLVVKPHIGTKGTTLAMGSASGDENLTTLQLQRHVINRSTHRDAHLENSYRGRYEVKELFRWHFAVRDSH